MGSITHAYLDLDSIAYVGACIAEKRAYRFTNKVDGTQSEEFPSAQAAKNWLVELEEFEGDDPNNWERETIMKVQPEEVAIKGVQFELKNWLKSIKDLTGNNDIIIKGYLTSSGIKTKDIKGLENRYQCNRYKDTVNWIPMDKPKHLKACRNYLLNSYDWIKLSPEGIEADAVVVFMAEKRGKKAVICSKDKDLKQAMNTNFIDMNNSPKFREIETFDELGELYIKENAKGEKSVGGNGFKLLCMQTIAGDYSDGYYGLEGVGGMFAYKLFKDCETIEQCCDKLVELYSERFPDGHNYVSWNGVEYTKSWDQLLIQHCQLAYHERGAKDLTNPIERYLNNEDIIKRYD